MFLAIKQFDQIGLFAGKSSNDIVNSDTVHYLLDTSENQLQLLCKVGTYFSNCIPRCMLILRHLHNISTYMLI